MLEEAVALIRRLWAEESVTHYGPNYIVEDARILDKPTGGTVPIIVSAFGEDAAELAAAIGDGLWVTGAASDQIETYRQAGGDGPVYSQITLCWAQDRKKAIETAHELWAFSSLPGQLGQDLSTILHFEQAVQSIDPEDVAKDTPCGPDPQPVIEAARAALDAGVDNLYFHQIGSDQEGFVDVWTSEIQPALTR
jgi:G6PDH family F420-dependent oxidoreductase